MTENADKKFRPDAGPLRSLILNAECLPEMQKGPRSERPFAFFAFPKGKGKYKHVDPTETF